MSRVAEFIGNHREQLVQRFLEEARRLEAARGLSPDEIIDTLPEYLDALAHLSRRGHRDDASEKTLGRLETMHIGMRLRSGYNQEEATREYMLLGELISSLWKDLPRESWPPPEDTGLLFAELQDAMNRVVATFSGYTLEDRQREKRALRQLDALARDVLGDGEKPVPLRERLGAMVEVVQQALGAQGASMLLADAGGRRLVPAASTGCFGPRAEDGPVLVGSDSFVSRVAESEEPLELVDAASAALEVAGRVRHSGARSLLGLRMWPHGKLLGVLYVGVSRSRPFEPQTQRYFETLVEYLSGIIEKALLLEQLRESHERLRQSETLHRLAVGAISDAIWDCNLVTNTLGWSGGVERLFGFTAAQLGGSLTGWTDNIHPEDRERVVEGLHHVIDTGGERWRDEYRFRRREGGYVYVTDHALIERDAQGLAVRVVGAMQDISERKRQEGEARERAQFGEQLLGIVSHDLRNPLNAILLSATALRRQGGDERQEKGLGRIVAAAERAVRMVRDLLDFTQARLGGGLPIRRAPMQLHGLVRQTVEEVRLAHPGREVELVQTGPDEGAWDADRLAQVVTNLVNNALAYSPSGARVRVETRGEAEAVVLSVHNPGEPIPPVLLPRLFEPLTRGSLEAGSAGRSIGLGLYIVERIVHAHGGKVDVHSQASEGTTFRVWLPREPLPS